MVEGKGFVDCAITPDATLARTKWQIVAFRGLACPFHALGPPGFGQEAGASGSPRLRLPTPPTTLH